jgi:hypothetical protein
MAMDQQIQLGIAKDVFWITSKQAKCSNSLPQFVKDLVVY